jgi:hypothetical protein
MSVELCCTTDEGNLQDFEAVKSWQKQKSLQEVQFEVINQLSHCCCHH